MEKKRVSEKVTAARPVVMVWLWLPDEQLGSANKRGVPFQPRQLLKFHPSVVGMLLLMMIFFIFPTNFAVVATRQLGLPTEQITLIMVGLDVVAFFVGMVFGGVMSRFHGAGIFYPPFPESATQIKGTSDQNSVTSHECLNEFKELSA